MHSYRVAANAHVIWESETDYFGTISVGDLDNESDARFVDLTK
jgi:hypothetical protein